MTNGGVQLLQETGTEEVKTSVQDRILNAAEELFAKSSFAGTRISEIALKAEVNQALIHYYFDSKEKLYQEVLARLFQQWEVYVQAFSWERKDPALMIREYIKTHFEIKCRMPNLYKIFHWEALEGGELFNKYASSTWVQDFLDKADMFKQWKLAGVISPQANEKVILFSLWGMMNQFYYRSYDHMKEIVGTEGSLSELQEEIGEQMVRLALHGIMAKDDHALARGEAGIRRKITILAADSIPEPGARQEEQAVLLDALGMLPDAELHIVHDELQASALQGQDAMLIVFASTKFGEIPESVYRLLDRLENNPSLIADRFVGIWTMGNHPASDTLQRTLEDAFNRLGAFAVARIPGSSPRDYIKRCAKLTGM